MTAKKTVKENGLKAVAQQLGFPNGIAPRVNNITTYQNTRAELYTLDRANLNQRYCTDGVFRKIVNQPVEDALKGELDIRSDLLNADQIDELKDVIEEKDIKYIVQDFMYWNRLFGGAGLICEIEGQDLSLPLRFSDINEGDKVHYYAVDRWEFSNVPYTSPDQLQHASVVEEFYYYNNRINKERLLLLKGVSAPSLIRPLLQGWGLSVTEPLIAPSNNYEKALNLIYELMDEAKIDVYKITGLNSTLMAGDNKVVVDKLETVNILKNFIHAIAMDGEDDFQQKQLNLSGIVDIIHELKLDICSAVDQPITKLFGTSPSGFSTGESDIRNYNSRIEAETRPLALRLLRKLLKIECKTLFGINVMDLQLTLPPLETMNQEQQEGAKDREFARLMQLQDKGLIQKDTLQKALNDAGTFINPIELDGSGASDMVDTKQYDLTSV